MILEKIQAANLIIESFGYTNTYLIGIGVFWLLDILIISRFVLNSPEDLSFCQRILLYTSWPLIVSLLPFTIFGALAVVLSIYFNPSNWKIKPFKCRFGK